MKKKRQSACWNLQVPKSLDEAVEKAIVKGWCYTKAEFIRQAVREKLADYGVTLSTQ